MKIETAIPLCQCGSYAAGMEGTGLCGGPVVAVRVGADAGVGVVGEGWKLAGIGEMEDRRGSLAPAGESAPPVLESALTFCHENTQTGRGIKEGTFVLFLEVVVSSIVIFYINTEGRGVFVKSTVSGLQIISIHYV